MNRMTNCLFPIITFIFNTGLAFQEYFSFRRIWVVLKRTKSTYVVGHSGSFSTDSLCQLYVFWHYRDPFSMNGTEICVFKESYKISLSCLLKCCRCCCCEPVILFMFEYNFTNKTLKWQFSDKEVHVLLYLLISHNATVPGLNLHFFGSE